MYRPVKEVETLTQSGPETGCHRLYQQQISYPAAPAGPADCVERGELYTHPILDPVNAYELQLLGDGHQSEVRPIEKSFPQMEHCTSACPLL